MRRKSQVTGRVPWVALAGRASPSAVAGRPVHLAPLISCCGYLPYLPFQIAFLVHGRAASHQRLPVAYPSSELADRFGAQR
jgi:hypothetical protein